MALLGSAVMTADEPDSVVGKLTVKKQTYELKYAVGFRTDPSLEGIDRPCIVASSEPILPDVVAELRKAHVPQLPCAIMTFTPQGKLAELKIRANAGTIVSQSFDKDDHGDLQVKDDRYTGSVRIASKGFLSWPHNIDFRFDVLKPPDSVLALPGDEADDPVEKRVFVDGHLESNGAFHGLRDVRFFRTDPALAGIARVCCVVSTTEVDQATLTELTRWHSAAEDVRVLNLDRAGPLAVVAFAPSGKAVKITKWENRRIFSHSNVEGELRIVDGRYQGDAQSSSSTFSLDVTFGKRIQKKQWRSSASTQDQALGLDRMAKEEKTAAQRQLQQLYDEAEENRPILKPMP